MPRKRKIILGNISAIPVAAAGTALIEIPLSFGRIHELHIQSSYTGGTNTIAAALALITEARVIVNGTVVRTFSGQDLRDLNLLNGTTYDCTGLPNTAPGVNLPIFFAEPSRKDARDQDALAWPSRPMNSFKVELQMTGGTAQTLSAFAVVDDVDVTTNPLYVKWIKQNFNAGGTSVDITTIDRRGFIQQISLFPSVALTSAQIKKDGIIIHELTEAQNRILLTNHGMAPAASGRTSTITDIVFDHDDLLGSSEQMEGSRDLTVRVVSGSAISTITGIIQRLEKLDGTN